MALTTLGQSAYSAPVNFQIPQNPPAGLPPQVDGAFRQIYNTLQQIIFTFVNNCGIGSQLPSDWGILEGRASTILHQNLGRFYVQASEAIAQGAMVNYHLSGTKIMARNANATNNTKPCQGFCSNPGGIIINGVGETIIGPGVTSIGGLTIAARYFLSTSNGQITNVAPVAAGNIEQYLGFAISTTEIFINPGYWIQH